MTSKPVSPINNVSVANNNTLSPTEWQELRTARTAALKANPDLVTRASQLSEKMRQFQQKLNAAMVKTDPNIAPVLAKFAGNRPAAHAAPQSSAKTQ
jgi:hypothetical protein